ncbi:MAG: lysoplasmalogenase [Sediminibacterium sp.]|nr:lysoplasmalogenase [Sediminibacterium sp.]
MEQVLNKRILTIYWIVLLLHCVFQFYVSPYRAVTKPLLVPLLLTYLLLKDGNIGRPVGKAMFYVGLFLAFFGDVLLILINDTFFLSGMIAFMLMNLFYSLSFVCLHKPNLRSILPFLVTMALLLTLGFVIYRFLEEEMGDYRMPVMVYLFTLSLMIAFAVNIALKKQYRKVALYYLIPGAVIFMIENILVAFNRFHWGSDKDVYIAVMATYGTAQYLMVKGILKAYA